MSTLKKLGNYFGFGEEEEYDAEPRHERNDTTVNTPVEDYDDAPAEVTPIRASVRPVETAAPAAMSRIQTIHPRSYNDAKSIGLAFREGIPVIMNLSAMDETNSKRLVDFSAGLIFGLRGSIEKVTNNVFLLTPASVEVTTETDAASTTQASFFNQS